MIDLGNGQYQIQNKKSGETRIVSGDDLPSYGLSTPAPEQTASALSLPLGQRSAWQADQRGKTQGMANVLRTIGFGAIPDMGADIYDTAKFAFGGGEKAFQNGYQNPLRTEDQLTQTRNRENPGGVAKNLGGNLAGLAAVGLPAFHLAKGAGIVPAGANLATRGAVRGGALGLSGQSSEPGGVNMGRVGATAAVGAVLEPILAALGFLAKSGLTKGKVYQNIEKATAKSTDHSTSVRDLQTEGKQAMSERMGSTYDLHKEESNRILNKLLPQDNAGFGRYNPITGRLEGKDLTPTQLLELRSRLSPEASQNYLQRLAGIFGNKVNRQSDLEAKVADSLRSIVSARLKEAAPNVVSLDKLYGIYNNPAVGPAWSWPFRAAGLGAAGRILPAIFRQ